MRSKTSASRWHGRRWASRLLVTRPAAASTLMCLDTAWIETSYGSASSPTVASPTASRATMSRLVGSASAAKTRESRSSATGDLLLSTQWLNRTYPHRFAVVNHLVEERGQSTTMMAKPAIGDTLWTGRLRSVLSQQRAVRERRDITFLNVILRLMASVESF